MTDNGAGYRSEAFAQACLELGVKRVQREAALQSFLHRYNWHRPTSALNRRQPTGRIPAVSNLLALDG